MSCLKEVQLFWGHSLVTLAFVMKISGLTFLGTYSLTKMSPGLGPTVHPLWGQAQVILSLLWTTGFLGGDELNQEEVLGSETRNNMFSGQNPNL